MNNIILTKTCTKCNTKKFIKEFHKRPQYKNSFQSWCKKCCKKQNKIYRLNNKEKLKQKNQEYGFLNKEKIKQRKKFYYLLNKEKIKQRINHYVLKNIEKIKQRNKKYVLENNEKIKKYHRKYQNNRLKNDVNFKIIMNCRGRIRNALINGQKCAKTAKLIMCSTLELRQHIERKWLTGMNWNNYGYGNDKWHIDHVIPCSFFNMSDPVEQYMCFRWQNLQPLWQTDNQRKSDKINLVAL